MRKFIFLTILLISYSTAKADCTSNGISCWPSGTTIKSNPIFVLEFYSESEKLVAGLNKKYAIYLQSGKQKIALIITETCKGQFYLTQVILKPSRSLTVGLEYTLVIDNLPSYERMMQKPLSSGLTKPIAWKVIKEKDMDAPAWIQEPLYKSKTMVEYGCGPAKSVNFNFSFEDRSDVLVKATVKNLRTGIITTYYVPHNTNTFGVGHDMCSGAFVFSERDNEYEAVFSLIDASGNISMTTKSVRFTQPTKEDIAE